MDNSYNINAACLRYVIPFKYKKTFQEASVDVEHQYTNTKDGKQENIWQRMKIIQDGTESDLYDYIRNEYRFQDDISCLLEQKNGCEWILRGSTASDNKSGKSIKSLKYFTDKFKKNDTTLPPSWDVNIINLGLLLFRNNVGFIWYEIELPKKTVMNSDQLKQFQNVIRELNRREPARLWEKQKLNTDPDFGLLLDEEAGQCREYKNYIIPFSIGNWINKNIIFLEAEYFAQRKSAYVDMIQKSLQCMEKLQHDKSGMSYKRIFPIVPIGEEIYLPDKAILFTYVSFENPDEVSSLPQSKYSLVYHLTNGYKDSYHFSDEICNEIKKPFEDVFWYATQEGTAYLAWTDSDNREVFNSLIVSKVKTDYFSLYLKVLYQSFSLLVYAEKIQQKISAINSDYMSGDVDDELTKLFCEINLFLTKSMATSVSHIHHQSEFYIYVKKQLRIQEDIESVTLGLEALDSLQREQRQREENKRAQEAWQNEQKRDREEREEQAKQEEREKQRDEKTQAIMGLFALLSIASALVDGFDFVSKFDGMTGDFWTLMSSTQRCEVILIIIVGIISLTAVFVSVKAVADAFKHKKNKG